MHKLQTERVFRPFHESTIPKQTEAQTRFADGHREWLWRQQSVVLGTLVRETNPDTEMVLKNYETAKTSANAA